MVVQVSRDQSRGEGGTQNITFDYKGGMAQRSKLAGVIGLMNLKSSSRGQGKICFMRGRGMKNIETQIITDRHETMRIITPEGC